MDRMEIEKRLKTQEAVEGPTENIQLLRRILPHLAYKSEWDAFVTVKHHKYGPFSYESHVFYYLKPCMKNLLSSFVKHWEHQNQATGPVAPATNGAGAMVFFSQAKKPKYFLKNVDKYVDLFQEGRG